MSFSNSLYYKERKYQHYCRDWTARHHQNFKPDIIFLSILYESIHNLIVAIPHCSAGDTEAYIPEEFQSD